MPRRNLDAKRASVVRRELDPRQFFLWRGPFENWARKYVALNGWKVRHILGSDEDALQHCAQIWWQCVDRYAAHVDTNQWMMALYKRAIANSFIDLARADYAYRTGGKAPRKGETHDDMPTLLIGIDDAPEPAEAASAPFAAKLAKASPELHTVLRILIDAPAEMLEALFGDTDLKLLYKENERGSRIACRAINYRLRKLIGASSGDLLGQLRDLLT